MPVSYFDGTERSAKIIREELLELIGYKCRILVEYRTHPIRHKVCREKCDWPFMTNTQLGDKLWLVVKLGPVQRGQPSGSLIDEVSDFIRAKKEAHLEPKRNSLSPETAERIFGPSSMMFKNIMRS
jgi:hypothetical protein